MIWLMMALLLFRTVKSELKPNNELTLTIEKDIGDSGMFEKVVLSEDIIGNSNIVFSPNFYWFDNKHTEDSVIIYSG
jgi:hypothetical protein